MDNSNLLVEVVKIRTSHKITMNHDESLNRADELI
jgi:hypothetical protein